MILPSLLEYSIYDMNKRIEQIFGLLQENKLESLIKTSNLDSFDNLHLHLDFVLPQFAKDRSPILTSLSFETIFSCLKTKFRKNKLNLTVHLMGELEDISKAWNYFKTFRKPKNWVITLFVPLNHCQAWKKEFQKYTIGAWIDLNQWLDLSKVTSIKDSLGSIENILVMTVVAGKSGQKLEQITISHLSEFIINVGQSKSYIVDGGWSQEIAYQYQNMHPNQNHIDFVSYGSFWGGVEDYIKSTSA